MPLFRAQLYLDSRHENKRVGCWLSNREGEAPVPVFLRKPSAFGSILPIQL